MVCGVHYGDNWQLCQGGHSYVYLVSPVCWRPAGGIKCGKGFLAFDAFVNLLADENGNISGPRTVLAGLGAGTTESLIAVTPFESIKTQLSETTCLGWGILLKSFIELMIANLGNHGKPSCIPATCGRRCWQEVIECAGFFTVLALFGRRRG